MNPEPQADGTYSGWATPPAVGPWYDYMCTVGPGIEEDPNRCVCVFVRACVRVCYQLLVREILPNLVCT